MNTVEKKFKAIPSFRLGEAPEGLSEANPVLYRRIIAKRALEAGYEEADIPGQSIRDLLSDIRHLCDGLGLDFAELDRAGYENYSVERHDAQIRNSGGTLRPSIARPSNDVPLPAAKASKAGMARKR